MQQQILILFLLQYILGDGIQTHYAAYRKNSDHTSIAVFEKRATPNAI